MLNRDIYSKAPADNRLANNGVAEVSEDRSEASLSVLRHELESFVCDGQYEAGLETILDKFLLNLGSQQEQPGVWISGFYGSGKSHLAKMLRALWTDVRFIDGATARSLAKLPSGIQEHLRELSVQGKRLGGLHAAAGKLGAGAAGKARMALLSIVFASKGLPQPYHQALFVMWLKSEGLLEPIRSKLQSEGRSLEQELPNMFVSGALATALLTARPGFASSEQEARQLLKAQFPQRQDVTLEEMKAAVMDALSEGGKFPLTLIVLDEVQQYIGDDAAKAYDVQDLTETLCKHFEARLLFIGTGQSALSGMPNLMRLMGRFPVSVTLSDIDVENVTRQIILAKKPAAQPLVESTWRDNLGEISRHLRGTKLEHTHGDEAVLTADYPILPVRRRFWERVLRTIDTTGTVSQLRSQLRVVHEAVLHTAAQPLGHVVSGDYLYDQIANSLLQTAQLPREVYENVGRLSAGNDDTKLKARLLKLIFLINKLPADAAHDLGLRATEEALADLLVTDLPGGSSELRKRLPALLAQLQNDERLVMALAGPGGTEYRLQTRESSAWYEEFRAQEAELKAAPQRTEQRRADLLKARFEEILKKVRVTQGKAKEERRLEPVHGEAVPKDNDRKLYLWIQDGWQTEEHSVIADAHAKGAENPTLFAYLPAQYKSDLATAIVTLDAAQATLRRRGVPSTPEGHDASRSMESRVRSAEKELIELLDRLFVGVRVFLAGGHEVTEGGHLGERLAAAAGRSVVRLYREFDVADHDKWDKVLEEARKGNLEALKAVGHAQEVDKHPVCQKILSYIGAGKKGAEIRDQFEGPPYGWPRDAIDGALYALLASGHVRGADSAGKPVDAKTLERGKLTQASFRQESVTISPPQLIKIRQLFAAVGVPCQPREEFAKVPLLLAKLREQATKAGGVAPAPLSPKTDAIDAVEAQSGNGQLRELFDRHDELVALSKTWIKVADSIAKRLPAWHDLSGLLSHAEELGPYAALKADADAVLAQRSLLAEPDPVRPLLDRVADLLRGALNARRQALADAFEQQAALLESNAEWGKLTESQRGELRQQHHLQAPEPLDLGTPTQIQDALDACSLQHWISRTQALPSRFEAARLAAAQLLKPNVVHVALPRRTLNDEAELKAWLAEVEAVIREKLKAGPVSL